MADPLVKIQWKNNSRPAMNETNLNAMQTNIETYVEDNMEEMQRKVDGVVSGMPIGSGCDYFGSTAPEDFMFADGSAISRTTYAELFAIIGTTYGAGDGSTTFNLPDKRTRVSVMRQANDDTFANLGATGGEKKHTLTVEEMPSHTHPYKDYTAKASETKKTWDVEKNTNSVTGVGNNDNSRTTTATGGGQAHNILQPYIVCNYIIKVQ
jgi:microcystin-dependent protein